MGKALLFLRVSTESQELENQKKELENYVKNLGYNKEDCVLLEKSGASAIKLDDDYMLMVNQLIEYIDSGEISCVALWSVDRVLRDEEIWPKIKKKLVEVAGTFDVLTGKVSYFEKGTSKAMTSLQKSISAFKGKMQSVVRYFATFVGVYEVIGAIKSGVSTVIEFDTALSEMRKVSSASTATLKELQERSFGVADQVGSTALQIQKSTGDFLRLGKSQ